MNRSIGGQKQEVQGLRAFIKSEITRVIRLIEGAEARLVTLIGELRKYVDQGFADHEKKMKDLADDYLKKIADLDAKLVKAQGNQGVVGEIRYSILSVEQFQEKYGTSWVLLDGRDIPDSTLSQLGWKQIPDGRGLFLRCKNQGRKDGKQNPDGDLQVGRYQKDELCSHDHGRTPPGANEQVISTAWPDLGFQKIVPCTGGMSSTALLNNLRTASTGGFETRPRCITVNAFVKIHDTRNFPTENEESSDLQAEAPQIDEQIPSSSVSSSDNK